MSQQQEPQDALTRAEDLAPKSGFSTPGQDPLILAARAQAWATIDIAQTLKKIANDLEYGREILGSIDAQMKPGV